jgi:hypothetical protein
VVQNLADHGGARTPEASGGRVGDRGDQTEPTATLQAGEHVEPIADCGFRIADSLT